MIYSTWIASTRLGSMVVCEWMEYHWDELGLPMNLAMFDGCIYGWPTSIPSFYFICALMSIVKSLAYYGHSKGLLNPIVSPFYIYGTPF
jgi:hypothetical protein